MQEQTTSPEIRNVEKGKRGPGRSGTLEGRSSPLSRIEPSRVRVVALVVRKSGQVRQYDCYAPDEEAGVESVISLQEGTIWLRRLGWARSKSSPEVGVRWTSTGLIPQEVGRVSVFRWPKGTSIRVFVDTK